MMLAALPIACVQTPPSPHEKSEKGSFSDFYWGEGGLYTGYPPHPFISSLFPVNYFELSTSRTFSLEG